MTAPVRFILLVIGLVIAGAILMAPRSNERLSMMLDEGKQAQVIALLEPRLAQGETDPILLAMLGRAYAGVGDFDRASKLLERYTALRPDDADAYGRRADLYKNIGDPVNRVAMLERFLAIKPMPSRAEELAMLYREQNQVGQERALLARFEPELTVESGLSLRLAQLYAAGGDSDAAIRVLMRSERGAAGARSAHTYDEHIFLAELLVNAGRSSEAVRLGKRWIIEWHEPWLDNRLLHSFILHAPADNAAELADAVAVLHPDIRLFLVRTISEAGGVAVAHHLLETWAPANPAPSMNEIAAFLWACREYGEPAIVWRAFGQVLSHATPDDVVMRFSEAIAAEFGIGALAPFWGSLPKTLIEHRPLLSARLMFHEHDLPMTKLLLMKTDLAVLEPSDRRIWVDLLSAVAPPSEVFAVMRNRRVAGSLPGDLLPQYARLAGGLGQEVEYRLAISSLNGKASDGSD
jgi:tetratricopeptide (TPR) repeat protein